MAGLAARGFGIAVVPRMDLLDQLPLKVISIARPAWERSIYMVSDERIYLSPVVRNFQRFVLEQQGGETETVQKCRQNEASRAPFLLISRRPAGSRRWSAGEPGKRRKRTIWGP